MDIEQLTKAQIVLLVLLVSFITSIATGIVTVTLMDQAPEAVTQVINRVVERTVERVVPDDSQTASAGETIKEVTVVVKENDLITDAIEKNSGTIVKVSERKGVSATEPGLYLGVGILFDKEGAVAFPASALRQRGDYVITLADGTHRGAYVATDLADNSLALLVIEGGEGETFSTITEVDLNAVKLGQTAIVLSSTDRVSVAIGIVTDVATSGDGSSIDYVLTDIHPDRVHLGSPLFNMFGEIIGLYTGGSAVAGQTPFTPVVPLNTIPRTITSASAR